MKPLSFWLGMLLMGGTATADTVSLIPVADTTISEGSAAHANGVSPNMIVGHLDPFHANVSARGLLRFDLSSLPSGAIVTSVVLTITVVNNASANTDTHSLHRLDADWLEGAATWISSGLIDWENAGGDFAPAADASLPVGGFGTYTFASTPALINTVQMWLTNTASNHGWILRSESEADGRNARRINTREAGSGQPTLVLGYILPPPPPTVVMTNPRVTNGNFVFDFVAAAGSSYMVQYKEALQPGDWTHVRTYLDPMGELPITFEDPLTTTNRFYRVISP